MLGLFINFNIFYRNIFVTFSTAGPIIPAVLFMRYVVFFLMGFAGNLKAVLNIH